jgi:ELWxxDGT repeat protein
MYFTTQVEGYGEELWKSDGTDAGTKLVKDIVPGVGSSEPSNLTVAGNELFFTVSQMYSGATQLWKTDGTEAGTALLKDLGPGDYNKYIESVFSSDQGVYFTYQPSIDDSMELWYSNGTSVGTYVVADQSFGFEYIDSGVQSGGILFFAGQTDAYGNDLWCSDGRSDWDQVSWFSERGIIVTPGRFYGEAGERHIRIALTASDEAIEKVVDRIRVDG